MVLGLFDTWNDALATGDSAKVADLYAPHAVLLPTVSNDVRTDRAGIMDYFDKFLQIDPVGEHALSPFACAVPGENTFRALLRNMSVRVVCPVCLILKPRGSGFLRNILDTFPFFAQTYFPKTTFHAGVINEYGIREEAVDDNDKASVISNSGIYTFTSGVDGSMTQARFTYVYEKIDGEWLILSHHSSQMPTELEPSEYTGVGRLLLQNCASLLGDAAA